MDVGRRRLLELGATMAGVAIAGCVQAPSADGAAAARSSPREPTRTTTKSPSPTATPTPASTATATTGDATHTVELTDDLRYVPKEIDVATGDTVVWENIGAVAHTVTVYGDGIPDGATYFASGGFESESAAREGFPDGSIEEAETYEHTFETSGEYEYFCVPHEQAGMTGTVIVG